MFDIYHIKCMSNVTACLFKCLSDSKARPMSCMSDVWHIEFVFEVKSCLMFDMLNVYLMSDISDVCHIECVFDV